MRRILAVLCLIVLSAAAHALDLTQLEPRSKMGFRTKLASCTMAKRCLTVFVAPWCGHCRHATKMINKVSQDLKWRNVKTRVVVCEDETAKMDKYAEDFGFDALIDDKRQISHMAVPTFALSDKDGKVLKVHPGEFTTEDDAKAWILSSEQQ